MEPTNCPNCNSTQPFNRQQVREGGNVRLFIRCGMCNWERTIFEGTDVEHKTRERINKLRAGKIKGVPVGRQLEAQTKRLGEELANGT